MCFVKQQAMLANNVHGCLTIPFIAACQTLKKQKPTKFNKSHFPLRV